MNKMDQNSKQVNILFIWDQSWQALKRLKGQTMQFGIWGLFIPFLLITLFISNQSGPVVIEIQRLIQTSLSANSIPSYKMLVELINPFFNQIFFICLILLASSFCVYFALLNLYISSIFHEKVISNATAFKKGVSFFLSKGIMLLILLILMRIEQLFFGPFPMFTLFTLMIPIIIMVEKKKFTTAMKHALFFKYASPVLGGGLSVCFMFLIYSTLLFAMQLLVNGFTNFILHADQWLGVSRSLWVMTIPGLDISIMQLIATIVDNAFMCFLIIFTSVFTVNVFYHMRSNVQFRI